MLTVRRADQYKVEELLPWIRAEYTQKTQRNSLDITIGSARHLPDSAAGGVIVSSASGKHRCDNTLEQRLALAYEGMLPVLRTTLLGPNDHRKFSD